MVTTDVAGGCRIAELLEDEVDVVGVDRLVDLSSLSNVVVGDVDDLVEGDSSRGAAPKCVEATMSVGGSMMKASSVGEVAVVDVVAQHVIVVLTADLVIVGEEGGDNVVADVAVLRRFSPEEGLAIGVLLMTLFLSM
uniref:Uncharacterized protein n=1 Tax=Setaria viridis TaxID=4556 RepID=A0A4U6T1E8_SETVI|nr:hypothetical protein SEVIR_9G239100v2 [Setaria viridis]